MSLTDQLSKAYGLDKETGPQQNGFLAAMQSYASQVPQNFKLQESTPMSKFSVNNFVDFIGGLEGTGDHQAQEQVKGQITYGYGILPSTAKKYGVEYTPDSDRKANALAVYSHMAKDFENEVGTSLDKLDGQAANAMLAAYINLGSFKNSPALLSKAKSGDIEGFASSLFDINNTREGGEYVSSKGLVARRAAEYNNIMSALGKQERVSSVEVGGSRQRPVFILKDSNGGVLKTVVAKYPLASSNSFKSVDIA